MEEKERLNQRIQERKRRGSGGKIPSIPPVPKYYCHVTNRIEEDDILLISLDPRDAKDFVTIWRFGSLQLPGQLPIRLYRMPEKNQYALLRPNGGDGTACGKLWGPALAFPLFQSYQDLPPFQIIKTWIKNAFVLELGAGWGGTAGVAASRMGAAKVAVTDGEPVMVQCLTRNMVAESTTRQQLSTRTLDPHLTAHILRWGSAYDASSVLTACGEIACDVVLGCDCIYDAETVQMMITTITAHLKCSRVIFCWETREHRYDAEDAFLHSILNSGFRIRYQTASLLNDLTLLPATENMRDVITEVRSQLDDIHGGDLNLLVAERVMTTPPSLAQEK
jgi:hypothetical protein